MALADDFYQDQRKANRRIAELLMQQGGSSAPTSSHLVGANRVLQGLLGGVMQNRADTEAKAREDRISALLAGMPGLGEPSGGSAAASADLQEPGAARSPDGMDRGISAGPRSPTFSPVTMAPPVPPADPSPYKVAGMPPPTNSQDTFRTPLDAMAPRQRGLAALSTAMGGQPPMTGATPPGAIPVPTEAIRPPAPAPSPAAAPAQAGIDPAQAKYIRALMAEPATRAYGMQLYTAAQNRALATAAEKPTFGKIGVNPATGEDVMGWIDPRRQTTTPAQLPGGQTTAPVTFTMPDGKVISKPEGADTKTWRNEMTRIAADAAAGKMTEAQAKGATYATRMQSSNEQVLGVENEGLSLAGRAAAAAPFDLGKYVQSGDRQKYDTAKTQWITAALRQESGATINPSEFRDYEIAFFPLPGEGAEVVEMKRKARQLAGETIAKSAGPGFKGPEPDVLGTVRKQLPELPQRGGDPKAKAPDRKRALKDKYGLE